MLRSIGRGWRHGPQLLFLAPGVPPWRWVRCSACGMWVNGYFLARNHHARTYHANDPRPLRWQPVVDLDAPGRQN